MSRELFDRLHTIRLEHESSIGCSALCQGPDGTYWAKLSLKNPACQKELLSILKKDVPVCLEDGVLEVLLPWREGLSLDRWRWEQNPTLGQRRDACQFLLEQLLEARETLPPSLIALSARKENLVVGELGVSLQYLPELCRWEQGMTQAQAVCGVACVIWEVLAPEQKENRRIPEELQLLYCRQKEGSYTSWGQLQRDLAAIPDSLPRLSQIKHRFIGQARRWLYRYGIYLLGILAAVLLAAALYASAAAFRHWRSDSKPVWPGMPQVGDQDLRREGDSR